ncbi:Small RNA 2'-O-methyltransferase [Entomortierella beljakovae]|nr:Small RNA 2'-O-methyltransferase [Entomortierella beljakovae]
MELSTSSDQVAESSQEATFFPPLWQQRRSLAGRIIGENNATSVIDYGCGEGALTSFLIWESTSDYPITRLAGVDIKEDRLKIAEDTCQPQDFELGSNLRVNRLSIDLYQGSVGEPDQRLLGYDALACLEVVEHLDPDVLNNFWSTVLGALRPKIVIVSTPNAEFNVNFPQLKYGTPESIFRNDDHRFEWTRQEFEDWCKPAALEYGYSVSFTGVGKLPDSDPTVGYCTQFAILKICEPTDRATPSTLSDCHSHLANIQYPYYSEIHAEEEISEYIHEKIAYIRPRPRQPFNEEMEGYFNSQINTESNNSPGIGTDETDYSISDEDEQELGVLRLDDLWLSLDIRQRCKNRSRMIEILEKSSVVQINLEEDKITFDDENEFWKKYDRQESVSNHSEFDQDCLEDFSDEDAYYYQDQEANDPSESELHSHNAIHYEETSGWDKVAWNEPNSTEWVPEHSPWTTPVEGYKDSSKNPWDSL